MKNSATFLVTVLVLSAVCFAANSTAAPAAPAGAMQASTTQVASAPLVSEQSAVALSEGSPMPLCQPGHCPPPSVRLTASEGSPMPLCQPGHCPPPSFRLTAREGSFVSADYSQQAYEVHTMV